MSLPFQGGGSKVISFGEEGGPVTYMIIKIVLAHAVHARALGTCDLRACTYGICVIAGQFRVSLKEKSFDIEYMVECAEKSTNCS